MTQDWSVPVWAVFVLAGSLSAVMLGLGLVVRATRRRFDAQQALTQRASVALAEQVAGLEARLSNQVETVPRVPSSVIEDRADYVITRIGDAAEEARDEVYDPLPRAVFADLVLRETAARAAGLGAGLRRALSPENRNRIRFEMKQEVKRSRKKRKANLRIARREWESQERGVA